MKSSRRKRQLNKFLKDDLDCAVQWKGIACVKVWCWGPHEESTWKLPPTLHYLYLMFYVCV